MSRAGSGVGDGIFPQQSKTQRDGEGGGPRMRVTCDKSENTEQKCIHV